MSPKGLKILKEDLLMVRSQPRACLESIGVFERVLMRRLGTYEAVHICVNDVALANSTMQFIDKYSAGRVTESELSAVLIRACAQFQQNSEAFQPHVEKTVQMVVVFVLTYLALAAAVASISTLLLARSIRMDYKKLKTTERALTASEAFLTAAGRVAEVGGWEYDVKSDTVKWTDQTYRNLEVPPGQEVSLDQFINFFLGEDRKEIEEAIQKTIRTREAFDIEVKIKTAKNNLLAVEVIGSAEVRSGEVVRVCGAIQNIDRRRLAEENARNSEQLLLDALNNLTLGIVVIDSGGKIENFNAAAEAIFGYESKEVLGKNVSVLMNDTLGDKHGQYIGSYLESREAKIIGIGREVTGRRENGEEFPLQLGIGEVRRGKDLWFVASIEDLTERKKLEEQLRHSQKMEAIGELTGGVAHDFNNILAIIQGNLTILLQELEELDPHLVAQIERLVQTALKASESAAVLTHRLLAFSRKQLLQPELLDLNKVVAGMEELLKRSLGETIELNWELPEPEMTVEIDVSQLENALINLSVNGRDAMPGGGVLTISTCEITVQGGQLDLYPELEAGDYVKLTVTDSGIGMDSALVERVFEPFFTTKVVGKGTGLGLSMVYGFAGQSGGGVSVFSKPGEGTTFNLYLPKSHRRPPVEDTQAKVELKGGNETILVVEDEEQVRNVVVIMLQRLGYGVVTAEDGLAAIDYINSDESIDLLLTDVVLPGGISGPEIVKYARAKRPQLHFLYMSGHLGDFHLEPRTGEKKINIIQKPFSYPILSCNVRDILDLRAAATK